MISIGLALLTSASKKLEARELWERKGGQFSAKHMDSGQTCRGAGELCLCSSTTDNKWYNPCRQRAEPNQRVQLRHHVYHQQYSDICTALQIRAGRLGSSEVTLKRARNCCVN